MKPTILLAVAVVCLVSQREGHVQAAQDKAPKAYGPAGASCGSWTAGTAISATSEGTGNRSAYMLWTEGYVSGAGYVLAGRDSVVIADTDMQGIQTWMTKYCSDHPLDTLLVAATNLVVQLEGGTPR